MIELMTVEEVAPCLRMKPQGIYRAIREKQFPFPIIKIGRQIRIPRVALENANQVADQSQTQSSDPNK